MARPDMIARDWAIVLLKDSLELRPIPLQLVQNAEFIATFAENISGGAN